MILFIGIGKSFAKIFFSLKDYVFIVSSNYRASQNIIPQKKLIWGSLNDYVDTILHFIDHLPSIYILCYIILQRMKTKLTLTFWNFLKLKTLPRVCRKSWGLWINSLLNLFLFLEAAELKMFPKLLLELPELFGVETEFFGIVPK